MKKIILNICVLLFIVNTSFAQEKNEEIEKKPKKVTVEFALKDTEFRSDSIEKPLIYVDGKLFNFDISLINQNKIESLFIVKGEEAKTAYNAPQGVYLITTKKGNVKASTETEIIIKKGKNNNQKQPLIFIDGKETKDPKALKKIQPDEIESVKVLKDEKAKEYYGGENGVIIIKTKKKE